MVAWNTTLDDLTHHYLKLISSSHPTSWLSQHSWPAGGSSTGWPADYPLRHTFIVSDHIRLIMGVLVLTVCHVAKFKIRQIEYVLGSDSPNLMLAKVSHYTISNHAYDTTVVRAYLSLIL